MQVNKIPQERKSSPRTYGQNAKIKQDVVELVNDSSHDEYKNLQKQILKTQYEIQILRKIKKSVFRLPKKLSPRINFGKTRDTEQISQKS